MFSSHNNEKKREYAKAPRKSDTLKKIYIFLNMIDKIGGQINVHTLDTHILIQRILIDFEAIQE